MLVFLFAVSAVSAAENITDGIVSMEETADDLVNNELSEIKEYNINNNDSSLEFCLNDSNNCEDILCSVNDDNLISYTDETILSSLPYQILIFCDDTVILGSSGTVSISISPYDFGEVYSYNFVVDICDSYGNPRLTSERYSGNNAHGIKKFSYRFNTGSLNAGTYTVKIVDYNNYNKILATSTFTLKYQLYDVSVQDTSISSESGGSISMTVSPSVSPYSCDFYLEIYDSKNNLKINERYSYSNLMGDFHLSYTINPNTLSDGVYTIKIINYEDNIVLNTAKLTVGSGLFPSTPYVPDYSVNVESTTLSSDNGGLISIFISPIEEGPYSWYRYHFSLKVYDSNNNEVINKYYAGETKKSFYEYYSIDPNKLSSGKYTIEIIDVDNEHVFKTATLTIKSYIHPSYSDYSVSVHDISIYYGSTVSIYMSISSSDNSIYKYEYYLKIYDSNNKEKISQLYSDKRFSFSQTYSLNSDSLGVGVYTIKIINLADNKVMDTAKLTIKSPFELLYSEYSVNVSDVIIDYRSSGVIPMNISPSSDTNYKYNFYLKIYDSDNNEEISELYSSSKPSYYLTYDLNSYLSGGVYTIKIINHDDNHVMDTALLTIKSKSKLFYSEYSINIKDETFNYGGGWISLSISPALNSNYEYYCYLKVFDSNNNEVISEVISELYSGPKSPYVLHRILDTGSLDVGVYTIKIINHDDDHVMDTAKLTIRLPYPYYSEYSVNVEDVTVNYGSWGFINMDISPAPENVLYAYYYYLKVYDSNNKEKISELYSSMEAPSHMMYYSLPSDLDSGVYTIKIINYADNKIMDTAKLTIKSSSSPSFNPSSNPSDYSIGVSDLTMYYKSSERFVVTVKDKDNKPIVGSEVKIYLNGQTYTRTTDNNGQASMAINLNSGKYNITTECGGKKVYSTVIIKDTVIAKDFTKIFRNGTQYRGTFVDSQGNLIKNTDVKININGVFYTRTTDGKGVAQMNINLPPGTYILTATNPLSGEQHTTKITVMSSIVENYDLTKYYKNASQYSLRLLDDKGNPVGAGVSIQLNINGVFYTRTSDANGYVKMNINLPPGIYTVTAQYNNLKASNNIIVLSVLQTKELKMSYKDGSKFEAKVLDSQGKPYAGQTVTFNINGVFYKKITGEDGIARLTINLMAGEYTITSSFNGLNAANKVKIRDSNYEHVTEIGDSNYEYITITGDKVLVENNMVIATYSEKDGTWYYDGDYVGMTIGELMDTEFILSKYGINDYSTYLLNGNSEIPDVDVEHFRYDGNSYWYDYSY